MASPMLLSDMLRALRAETGKSLNPALGVAERENLVYLLQRTQQQLYEDHDWPFLVDERDVAIALGTRFYAYPADMPFDYVADIYVANGATWTPLDYGITPEHLSIYNSDAGFTGFPPLRWQHDGDSGLFQLWPVPAQAGTLRVRGQRALRKLVDDSDTSTLDGLLIVLTAAAEVLARQKAEDAQYKLGLAQKRLRAIQTRQGANKLRQPIVMGGGVTSSRRQRVGIDFIPIGFRNGS